MAHRDYYEKKPLLGESKNALIFLFACNAFIFLILGFLKVVYYLEYDSNAEELFAERVLVWFSLSPDTHVFITRPWTIISFMFTHGGVITFICNMLWLWAFGYILQDLVGNRHLVPLYLYGGFFAGVVFLIVSALVQSNSGYWHSGSSAALMAVAIGTTALSPRYRIYQHIGSGFSLWILTLIFIIIDFATVAFSGSAVIASHIVAALIGFAYVKQLQSGKDLSNWMYQTVAYIDNLFNPEKKYQHKKQSEKVFYESNVPNYIKTVNLTQKRIDEILDKINNKGYDSLSNEDKDFLDRASKEAE